MNPPSLAIKSLHAIKWNYIGVIIRVILQFSVVIILARVLGPEPFGFLSIALIVIGIGNIFVSLGIGEALIQRITVTDDIISPAFTLLLILGFMASGITIVFSDNITSAFNSKSFSTPLKIVSITFVLHSLGIVPRSILRRDLDFKYIQLVQSSSYFIGFFLVGITSAINGLEEWSFVYALLSQSITSTTLLYAKVRHSIALSLNKKINELLKFGTNIVQTNLLNWTNEKLDTVLIGRFFGSTQLGLYNVTYTLVRTPINHLVVSLQSVMFPLSSRLNDREQDLARLFYSFITIIGIITFPVFFTVSALSEVVLNGLYGPKWIEASGILIPLSLAMIPHAIMAVTGPILWGMDKVKKERNIQFIVAIIFTVSVLFASQISMLAVAWTVFFIYTLRAILMIRALSSALKIKSVRAFNSIKGGALLGILVSTTLVALNALFTYFPLLPAYQLLLIILFGATTLLLYSYFLRRFLMTEELVFLLNMIIDKSSARTKRLIENYLLEPK